MCEHDMMLPELNGKKITAAAVNVDTPNKAHVNGKAFSIEQVKKSDFEEVRKLLNGNTLKKHVARHNKKVNRNLNRREGHMDIR